MEKPYLRLQLHLLSHDRVELLQQLHDFIKILESAPVDSFHNDYQTGYLLDTILTHDVPVSSARIEVVT
jgi:hypothetical protein